MTRQIVEWTTQKKPDNATHWSTRTLAEELGASHIRWSIASGRPTVSSRTWRGPSSSATTRTLSRNGQDVVGLYLNPPEHALVLCVDEKSQIQALDRTQPGLPIKKGRCGTMTHDYKRNGTTTLFAALETGRRQAHRHLHDRGIGIRSGSSSCD